MTDLTLLLVVVFIGQLAIKYTTVSMYPFPYVTLKSKNNYKDTPKVGIQILNPILTCSTTTRWHTLPKTHTPPTAFSVPNRRKKN